MEYNKITEASGYKIYEFVFEGKKAFVYAPDTPAEGSPWLFKTEYFRAFPDFQDAMVKKGWHLAHIASETRWYVESDNERRARFAQFIIKEFSLNEKCIPVGMSCGGMQAVYFGARYPQFVKGLYLDAPVMNFLSCPFAVGVGNGEDFKQMEETTGLTLSKLINYRNHPIDRVDELIHNKIPVLLCCGDSDTVVPYIENGALLSEKYKNSDVPFVEFLKPGCDHHPHSLEDNTPIIEWAEKLYYEV